MAAKSFLRLVAGKLKAIQAVVTSAGAGNDGDIVALDAAGRLDPSVLPIGVGPDVTNLASFENLTSGDYVNIFDDAGTVKARKADNSNSRPAHGYIKDTVVAPATVNVFYEGANPNLAGLTKGVRIYLGITGGIIETPLIPITDVGKTHQFLGIAISATEVNTDISDCIQL
mgnify:CR=1 FL=1|tara:strand:+ start:21473 stop:21985 length:513 start_codon:yes stop_codon:yes gene_type:complete